MIKLFFLLRIFSFLLLPLVTQSQNSNPVQKTGWLFYYSDKVIWFESKITARAKAEYFFTITEYKNGLIVNSMPLALYYRSIAKGYEIKVLFYDSVSRREDYTLKDSIWVIPVKMKYTPLTRSVSEILEPMGLSFVKDTKNVTVIYNFETNYDLDNVELLRKSDRRRLKRVKNYTVYSPH